MLAVRQESGGSRGDGPPEAAPRAEESALMHFPGTIPHTARTPRGNDVTTLSLRRLWITYKRTPIAQGTDAGKRDLQLSQVAFYAGARGVLKVLDHTIADSDYEGLHKASSATATDQCHSGAASRIETSLNEVQDAKILRLAD
jgi:hypothetical protein